MEKVFNPVAHEKQFLGELKDIRKVADSFDVVMFPTYLQETTTQYESSSCEARESVPEPCQPFRGRHLLCNGSPASLSRAYAKLLLTNEGASDGAAAVWFERDVVIVEVDAVDEFTFRCVQA